MMNGLDLTPWVCSAHAEVILTGYSMSALSGRLLRTRGGDPSS